MYFGRGSTSRELRAIYLKFSQVLALYELEKHISSLDTDGRLICTEYPSF